MATAQYSGIGNYFCASHEQNDPYRFNIPKTYKKNRPKVFYRATVVPSESSDVPTPPPVMTAHRKKLALSSEASTSSQPSMLTTEDGAHFGQSDSDYPLVRMPSLKMAVSVFSCCGSPLAVTEEMQCRKGLVSQVYICCTVCEKKSLVTDPYREEGLAVNNRFILGMKVIGKGRAAMESLTGIMGMLPPLYKPRFSSHTKAIHVASTAEKEDQFSSAVAVLRKHAKDDKIIDMQVNCDGTWSKRGHQGIYGVVIAAWATGQVIDTAVHSKYCAGCQAKRERTHSPKSSWIGMRNTKYSVT